MNAWKIGAFAALLVGLASGGPALAQQTIKIGILNDQSGPFADLAGPGSVVAAKLALEDFGGKVAGKTVELLVADHQNKADVGSSIARSWYASGVDAIADVPNSSVALAVNTITREQNKVYLAASGVTTRLTGDECSPNTVQWALDTWAMSNGTAHAMTEQGAKSWYFLTADYAFGIEIEKQVSDFVKAAGGTVLGSARHPIGTVDFSSFILGAQGSGAKVLALANSGADTVNAVKQAREFHISDGGMRLVSLALYISDVHSLGLELAQGLYFSDAFYWDLNDGTRAFSKRFAANFNGRMPTVFQAAVYSSIVHYLKALQQGAPVEDGAAVVAKMKAIPTEDAAFGKGSIRIDGRKIHPIYTFRVKAPGESKGPWDYYEKVATLSADKAWRPLSQDCELVRKR
jgi:branched-chain amino acid transport system substrate-binding protein